MPKNQRRRTRRNENQKTVSDVRSETVFCVIEKELFAYIMESWNIFFVHK